MNTFLFCQLSNKLLNKSNKKSLLDNYYNSVYKLKRKDGYCKNEDFFELPLWIAEIDKNLNGFKKSLFIMKNLKNAIKKLNNSEADYFLFSVLDINKKYILELIKNYKGKGRFLLGGYINFTAFKKFHNVIILNSVKDLCEYLKIKYTYGLKYNLFKNYHTIPRLTLSEGCRNFCKFCMIKKKIKEKSSIQIIKQAKSFKPLKFELVYLNDKTFGQAGNYIYLKKVYKIIKRYNRNFKGFIIQTTTSQLLNKTFINNLKHLKIYACEIGIESYNNKLLRTLRKPQNTQTINKAIKTLKKLNIKIIGNFIIGIMGENKKTYDKTLNFIEHNLKNFFLLNIYNLAVYLNTELSKKIKAKNDSDLNENVLNKSFYTTKQKENNLYFYNKIFKLAYKILKIKRAVVK